MVFTKKTVRDADVDGKRVLMRVDFQRASKGRRWVRTTPAFAPHFNHPVPSRPQCKGHPDEPPWPSRLHRLPARALRPAYSLLSLAEVESLLEDTLARRPVRLGRTQGRRGSCP